jgi:hypothetical protein
MNKIIFVILPYRDVNPDVISYRVSMAEKYCAKLMVQGDFPLCITSFGHYLCEHYDLPKEWDYWAQYCREMIRIAKEVHLLKLEGWDTSEGIQEEIKLLKMTQKPLIQVELEDI